MRQQRILTARGRRVFNICPALHKVPVRHDPGQLAGDGAVHGLGHGEVRGEEDIKIALMDLFGGQYTCEAVGHCEGDLTKGVVTGTIRRWYRVCTTGAFSPLTACGKAWKSEVNSLWPGKYFSSTSKNCISRVGTYSGSERLAEKGSFVDRYLSAGLEG